MPPSSTAGQEPDALRSFLVGLATDPAQLGRYVRDPDGALADAGLSDEDRAIVRSGHAGAIHARLRGQSATAALLVVDIKPGEGGAQEPQVRAPLQAPPLQLSSLPVQPPPVHHRPPTPPIGGSSSGEAPTMLVIWSHAWHNLPPAPIMWGWPSSPWSGPQTSPWWGPQTSPWPGGFR